MPRMQEKSPPIEDCVPSLEVLQRQQKLCKTVPFCDTGLAVKVEYSSCHLFMHGQSSSIHHLNPSLHIEMYNKYQFQT